MTDIARDQRDFMYMGNQTTVEYNPNQIKLYTNLIIEEFIELLLPRVSKETINKIKEYFQNEQIINEPVENVLKEATDLLVVTLGFIYSHGINPNDVWNLVHANNMAKVNDSVVKDENGKIMKSPESKARKERMMDTIRKLV